MESVTFDWILGSSLVPTIMSIVSSKMHSNNTADLLYSTATAGVVLSTVGTSLHFQIRSCMRPTRNYLTLYTALLLTISLLGAIIGFHLIRLNSADAFLLPDTMGDVFRLHLYADIIPGCIIFSQTILCLLIQFDLINRAKRTFSYGESLILAQLASTLYLIWALTIYSKTTGVGPFQVSQTNEILLNLGIIMFGILFLPSYLILKESTIIRYILVINFVIVSYCTTSNIIKTSRVNEWIVDYIFATHQRISLFSLWLSTVAGCIGFSTSWSKMVGQTNSLVRKVFHLAICVVFTSGFNQDLDFLRFASGGMIIIMTLLEMARAWNLWPIGSQIEKVCQALRGKWDNRYLTLSHLYLLIGTMLPLWLLPPCSSPTKLSLSSGLLSVGVGDTAAAVIGKLFGRTQLGLKSDKTLEGFAGNILAMAAFKLIWVGYSGFQDEFAFAFSVVITAFVEVLSHNCDNLILPLTMMLCFEIF